LLKSTKRAKKLLSRRLNTLTDNITYSESTETRFEIRKIQALTGERSFTLVFPKNFAVELGVGRGDFLKCYVNDGRLIVEKART
jgi:hypothetical protein